MTAVEQPAHCGVEAPGDRLLGYAPMYRSWGQWRSRRVVAARGH